MSIASMPIESKPKSDGRHLLTHSRMQTAKTCLKKHYFAYELGIRRSETSQPLRMGSALHLGIDLVAQGKTLKEAVEAIERNYSEIPSWITDVDDWLVEREICVRLLCGYVWRWENDESEIVQTELSFDLPITNPETGAESKLFRMAGKIDKVIRYTDGRLAIREHKTTSDSLASDSEYWRRLRLDQQISLYMIAARGLGYNVETVEYDVIHKPQIRPKKLDKNARMGWSYNNTYCGEPFPFDQNCERETPGMFGARLTKDIGDRPEFYFARMEIPRLEADLDEFRHELWQTQQLLRNCQRNGHWFRNSQACLSPYPCEYRNLCFNAIDPANHLPEEFHQIEYVHEELL